MSFIGDYVHYYKKDYLQYSITQNTPTSFNPNQVLEEQLRDIKRMLEEKYKHEKFDFAGIEDQLNFYFYNINNTHLENNMTDEQFQQVHNAIMAKINAGLVKIDPFTLSSAVNKGGIDEKALQQQIQLRDKKIKTIEQWASSVLEYDRKAQKQHKEIKKSTIENRILFIEKAILLTDSTNLIEQLNVLKTSWGELQNAAPGAKQFSRADKDTANILILINELIKNFKMGSSTLHGLYAEYIVEFTNMLAQNKATKTFTEIVNDFSASLNEMGKKTKGQSTSRKALLASNFSHDFVDLNIVVDNNPKWRVQDEANGNYIYAAGTQDKVDVDIAFQDFIIPASVKNYNFNNPISDMHFLEGRSILTLLQDNSTLLNHYLNIAAPHGDSNFDNKLIAKSNEVMKLSILLKALEGGVYALSGKGVKQTEKAEIIVINDNTQGKFRVFSLSWILDKVENKVNELVKTGEFDTLRLYNNWAGGKKHEYKSAKVRISKMLAQLHGLKVSVSIPKEIFLDSSGNF